MQWAAEHSVLCTTSLTTLHNHTFTDRGLVSGEGISVAGLRPWSAVVCYATVDGGTCNQLILSSVTRHQVGPDTVFNAGGTAACRFTRGCPPGASRQFMSTVRSSCSRAFNWSKFGLVDVADDRDASVVAGSVNAGPTSF